MSSLEAQRLAIGQFQAVTNQTNDELSRQILAATDWQVEAAVARLYDEPSVLSQAVEEAQGSSADGIQAEDNGGQAGRTFQANPARPEGQNRSMFTAFARGNFSPLQLIALPFRIIFSILTPVLALFGRLLRLPRVNVASFSLRPLFSGGSNGSGSGNFRLDPTTCAARTVRELEEELGTVSTSATAYTSAVDPPVASSSKQTASSNSVGSQRSLPDFHIGSYDSALRKAKEEIRPLCVILFTSEHQDAEQFKRKVLLDQDLGRTLSDRNFVTWIGDLKYSDAFMTSKILEATTYPFFAFITLSPPRTAPGTIVSASIQPKMTVFSRLEGSPSTVTAPLAIVNHINGTVIPRTSSFMDRLRREKGARDAERTMRAEQDRAYEEAANRDVQRIRAKERQLEQSRLEAEQRERLQRELKSKEENQARWRRWASENLVPSEPSTSAPKSTTTRLSVKLPDGRRLMRTFARDNTLEQVYAWVDTSAFLAGPKDEAKDRPANYMHDYAFTLVNMFPKRSIAIQEGSQRKLNDIEGLCPSASLVVEGMQLAKRNTDKGQESDDEESDEE